MKWSFAPLAISLITYLASCVFLYSYKPSCMFDEAGKLKKFGFEHNETRVPFWLVSIFIGMVIYTIYYKRNVPR